MPKHNPDYSKTIIYKLINYDHPDLVYVGSTTNLTRRKAQHKSMVNENSQTKLYRIIQQHGGWDSWHLIKICDYPCSSSIEARQGEDKYMMELKANLNTLKAYTSDEEKKQYREKNKEHISDYSKQYYESHKQQICEQNKQYRETNKEKIREREKQYREKNKQKINEKASEKIECDCGCHIRKSDIAKHKKTAKHQRSLSSNSSSSQSSDE